MGGVDGMDGRRRRGRCEGRWREGRRRTSVEVGRRHRVRPSRARYPARLAEAAGMEPRWRPMAGRAGSSEQGGVRGLRDGGLRLLSRQQRANIAEESSCEICTDSNSFRKLLGSSTEAHRSSPKYYSGREEPIKLIHIKYISHGNE